MTWGAVAVVAQIGGGLIAADQAAQSQAAANASNAALSAQQLNEQRFQFDLRTGELSRSRREREDEINRGRQERFQEQIQRLDPFTQAGQRASTEESALLGLSGQPAQQEAFSRFTESPGQQFLRERQERSLLRSASAIGGLGGGNVRTALQEQAFGRAQTDLDRQLSRLGGVAERGRLSAGQQIGDPGFVQTGVDVGVREGDPRAPLDPVGTAGAGGGLLGGLLGGLQGGLEGLGGALTAGGALDPSSFIGSAVRNPLTGGVLDPNSAISLLPGGGGQEPASNREELLKRGRGRTGEVSLFERGR